MGRMHMIDGRDFDQQVFRQPIPAWQSMQQQQQLEVASGMETKLLAAQVKDLNEQLVLLKLRLAAEEDRALQHHGRQSQVDMSAWQQLQMHPLSNGYHDISPQVPFTTSAAIWEDKLGAAQASPPAPWVEAERGASWQHQHNPSSSLDKTHAHGISLPVPTKTSAVRWEDNPEATTLMVRNVPVRYTQDVLLSEWPAQTEGFNFLYLPACIKKKCNSSFAFVNFVSPEAAQSFAKRWHQKRLKLYHSRKALDISLAEVQGLDTNLRRYCSSKAMRLRSVAYQPAVFEGHRRVSLEEKLQTMSSAQPDLDGACLPQEEQDDVFIISL
eukprot:TRINITY_DN31305_c0_g1_i1.p1 TRINITY_DN31305_c0_g1~~TRINITY_DN31305_c0_g1_i1.p1  ORF type:complete len:326 (-),score=79.35 TRINITY_DN31305_c0_g1_i1:93-1070(-)